MSLNVLDRARREIYAALLMEYHRTPNALTEYSDLVSRYNLKAPESLFDPIVSEIEHYLIFSRTYTGLSVRLKPAGYPFVFSAILEELNAQELTIDWNKEEILTDGVGADWFPMSAGWKWLQFENAGRKEQAVASASDRLVSFDHNSREYQQISTELSNLAEQVRSNNEVGDSAEHRDQLVRSISAAVELWAAAQLKIIQIKIGVIMAVEDAVAALSKVGKSVGLALIVDGIKALVRSKTGLEI